MNQTGFDVHLCAGSPRLPGTALCQAEAAALLLAAPGTPASPPPDCAWVVAETALEHGTALLYRAARCRSGTARLAFARGAQAGTFSLAASPFGGEVTDAEPIARIYRPGDADAILRTARADVEDPAERARCRVRPAAMDDWPRDALVVDEVPAPPADGIRSACGPLGYDGGAQTFWRIGQGVAWFFSLGQDYSPVDAGSFTLVTKASDGRWHRSRTVVDTASQ